MWDDVRGVTGDHGGGVGPVVKSATPQSLVVVATSFN